MAHAVTKRQQGSPNLLKLTRPTFAIFRACYRIPSLSFLHSKLPLPGISVRRIADA